MNFPTQKAFVNFKAKSGYRKMTTLEGEIFMYKANGGRIAVYSWNEFTGNVEQMILPYEVLKTLNQSAI